MKSNFMKYPTAPITAKPTAQELAICKNSNTLRLAKKTKYENTFFIGLSASIDEESRILDKVLGIINEILSVVTDLLGHFYVAWKELEEVGIKYKLLTRIDARFICTCVLTRG